MSKSPVLFLHGAWHGSWCWEPVARGISALGHPTLAIDLPGHGLDAAVPTSFDTQDLAALATERTRAGDLSSADVAAKAIEAVGTLFEAYGPVVVVAHSLAGVTLHQVGEAIPEKVAGMVYLAALAPAPGRTVFEDAATPAFADSLFLQLPLGDPAVIGVVRINWRSADAQYRALARDCFYGGVAEATAAAAGHLLTPDAPVRLYADPVELTEGRWGSIPRTWIRCSRDRAVPVAAQDADIAALDELFPTNPYRTVTLEADHSPFLSDPDGLTAALGSVLQDR